MFKFLKFTALAMICTGQSFRYVENESEITKNIQVLGRFVEYSPMSMWSMWTEEQHYEMISTFMLFKLLEPKEHIGRLVNVRIDCGKDKTLTSLKEKCIGNYFSFYLPREYLESDWNGTRIRA